MLALVVSGLDGTDERIDLATLRSAAMDAGIRVLPAITTVGVLAGVFTYLKGKLKG